MKLLRQTAMGALIMLAACNTVEPVQSITDAPMPHAVQQKYSDGDVGKIIAAAAINKGWQVDEQRPGMVHVMLHWNNYSAQAGVNAAVSCVKSDCKTEAHDSGATITYTQQRYTIMPDPSPSDNLPAGLGYRQFNKYVDRLRREIDKNLNQAAHH